MPVLGLLAEFADGLARAGRVDEGLTAVGEALDRVDRTDERWCLAELLRIKGELVLLGSSDEATPVVEDLFEQSLHWARNQDVLSWRLRTAISLARLRRKQGRTQEAHDVLTSVYDCFTDGFETADLVTARQLIEELR